MYKSADEQYNKIIKDIINDGVMDNPSAVRTVYADDNPAPTKALINVQMKFDNGKQLPILTTKKVAVKDPIKELLWIWQKMSNKVFDLQQMGCNVWNEWELSDGSIGRAYGWQLANKRQSVEVDKLLVDMIRSEELSMKFDTSYLDENETLEEFWEEVYPYIENNINYIDLNQVDYLLYSLKKNPSSRRHKTTLWCVEDLEHMALQPCVYETHWQVFDGKLALTVNVRSNDMALGNPYNVYQYAILHRMIAQVSGIPVGELCFNIDNAHIYDRHIDKLQNQIQGEIHETPEIWINPEVKSFFEFTLEDIKIIDYKNNGSFKYEIAI